MYLFPVLGTNKVLSKSLNKRTVNKKDVGSYFKPNPLLGMVSEYTGGKEGWAWRQTLIAV